MSEVNVEFNSHWSGNSGWPKRVKFELFCCRFSLSRIKNAQNLTNVFQFWQTIITYVLLSFKQRNSKHVTSLQWSQALCFAKQIVNSEFLRGCYCLISRSRRRNTVFFWDGWNFCDKEHLIDVFIEVIWPHSIITLLCALNFKTQSKLRLGLTNFPFLRPLSAG